MISFTQSPFLQALGVAIINSLWQFALLWLLYFVATGIFNMSSRQKYLAGIVVQIAGFTWFLLTLLIYYNQGYSAAFVADTAGIPAAAAVSSFREKLFVVMLQSQQFLPYLSMAYLAMLVLLAAKWLKALQHTGKIKTRGLQKIDVDWRLFVQKVAEQMGIKRPIKIYLSSLVNSPLTIGFFKPVILIPLATINHLTAQQMEAVLLHEIAHIKRMDYLVNILLSIVEGLFFFNPFTQLIARQIHRERENCCDDWVLQYEYNAATYARALLQLATHAPATSPAFAMHATDQKKVLLTRVKRMIEKQERKLNYHHHALALLLFVFIFFTVSLLAPVDTPVAQKQAAPTDQSFSMAVKVDNPLFNPMFLFASKTVIEQEIKTAEKVLVQQVVKKRTEEFIAVKKVDAATPELNTAALKTSVAINTAKTRYRVVKTDTGFTFQIRRFLAADFWKELKKTEEEMKWLQLAMTNDVAIHPYIPQTLQEVEIGLKALKEAKEQLIIASTKLKGGKEQQQLKHELKALALHSMAMKNVADEWNAKLKEAGLLMADDHLPTREPVIFAAAIEDSLVVASTSTPALQKAVYVATEAECSRKYKVSEWQQKAPKNNQPAATPLTPTSVISIKIAGSGKIIKVVKI